MKRLKKIIACLLAVTILTATLCGCSEQAENNNENNNTTDIVVTIPETENYLIKDGRSDYVIVIPETPVSWEVTAGNELSNNIYKATNFKIPVKFENENTQTEKLLVVGQTELTKTAGISAPTKTYGARGFVIKNINGNIYILGGNTQGTLYGVYEFLHHQFGYEPYAIDEIALETGVTDKKLLAFDVSDIPDIPYIQGVHEYYRYYNAEAGHRMRFNTYNEIFIGSDQPWHNVFSYLPKNVYQKDHPKWYSNDGRELHYTAHGDPEELQLMQDTIFNKMVEMIEKDFSEGKYYEQIGFMQNDHPSSFPSDDSPVKDENGENLWENEPDHVDSVKALQDKYGNAYCAAMLIKFINPLQERISQYMKSEEMVSKYGERKMSIMFFAYEQSEAPPVKTVDGKLVPIDEDIVLHPDASVFMALIRANYIEDYENSGATARVKGWEVLASNQAFWFYNFYFNTTTFVHVDSTYSLQTYFQAAKEANASYVFFESPMTKNHYFPFNNLTVYLYSKLGWDVDVDVHKLIDNFFINYYKDAADSMREYFDSVVAYYAYIKETTTISGVVGAVGGDIAQYWKEGVLSGWMDILNRAFEDIEHLKYTDKTLYDELYSRILYDTIMPRYLLLRHFAKEAFTDQTFMDEFLKFKEDCATLEITKAGDIVVEDLVLTR